MACPFCREMFEAGEARSCPECGLALKRLEELPQAKVVGDEALEEVPPDEEVLPWTYAGRARGPLLVVAVLGIAAFFLLPWVREIAPERMDMTGPQIANRLGWMWAPFVAWLVMIPLVLSRRSVFRMRGARVAVAFLAGMSLMTVIVSMSFKPAPNRIDPHILESAGGLYVTGVLSLIGIALALMFGGRIDDLTTKQQKRSSDETLH